MPARRPIDRAGRMLRLGVAPWLLACTQPTPGDPRIPDGSAAGDPAPPAVSTEVRRLVAPHADGLALRRTMCFGRCPAYEVTVWPDGSVTWWGFHDVARVGPARGSIAVDEAARLTAQFDRLAAARRLAEEAAAAAAAAGGRRSIDFVGCDDAPSTRITLTRGGQDTRFEEAHCGEGPTPLSALAAAIDETARTGRWIADDPCKPVFASGIPMVCLGDDADRHEVCATIMPRILEAMRTDERALLRLWAVDGAAGVDARLDDALAGIVRGGVPSERVVRYLFPAQAEDPDGWDDGSVNIEVGSPACMRIAQ